MDNRRDLPNPDHRALGVISRRQALDAGIHRRSLAHRIQPDGPWQRILPGVYLMTTGVPTADQRRAAALVYAGPQALLAGPTALAVYGVGEVQPDRYVHILIPHARRRVSSGYVLIHRTAQQNLARMRLDWPVCDLSRAVVDSCLTLHRSSDVQALISTVVQQRRVTVEQLLAAYDDAPRRGSALLRAALADLNAGTRSAPEAEFRALIRQTPLPEPQWNVDLFDPAGRFLGRPDAWWAEAGLAHEMDSRRHHSDGSDWARTLVRHNTMTAAGITVLHTTPARLRTAPRIVVAEVIATHEQGLRRPQPPVRARPHY
jgi:hypothetical protein